MQHPGDVIVAHLCGESPSHRVFRDEYQVPALVGLWRNYVNREDRFNRYAEMTSHGPTHVGNVAALVTELALPFRQSGGREWSFLNDSELLVLLGAAYLHDVGMYRTFDRYYSNPWKIRGMHGALSRQGVLRDAHLLMPHVPANVVALIALLCSYHQKRAALSEQERLDIPTDKRQLQPCEDCAEPSSYLDGVPLLEMPSLQTELARGQDNGIDYFHLPNVGEPVCPFILATLLKLLDGCDFQITRNGSVEAVFRHADRNQSHALRSQRIMQDCPPETASHQRARMECSYFTVSVFHFFRNLLIERTFITADPETGRARIVIKPADPDGMRELCRALVEPPNRHERSADDSTRRLAAVFERICRYQEDPLRTVSEALGLDPAHSELREWQVSVPPGCEGDRRTVHFEVAAQYVREELDTVAAALRSPDGQAEYRYCSACANHEQCSLKTRKIPSLHDDNGRWDVSMYGGARHAESLVGVPTFGRAGRLPARGAFPRHDAVGDLVETVRKHKQVLLYGPLGRGKTTLARDTALKLATGDARLLWHNVESGGDQVAGLIESLADFLALNGEFALQNVIRNEHITSQHEAATLKLLRSGRLAARGLAYVACLDGFNHLTTGSRDFFRRFAQVFPCASCGGAAECRRPDEERWGCENAGSYVLLVSTKMPSRSWTVGKAGGLPATSVAAPPLTAADANHALERALRDASSDTLRTAAEIWADYGREPVGLAPLERVRRSSWDAARRVEVFATELAAFFSAHFDQDGLGGSHEVLIMDLIGLLDHALTAEGLAAVLALKASEDEGPLQRLMDRDLVWSDGGRLSAHPAWRAGRRRSRWTDRISDDPWPLLIGYVAAGPDPAPILRANWEMVSAHLPELAALEGLEGGGSHVLDVLSHSLAALERLGDILERLPGTVPEHAERLRQHLGQRIRGRGTGWPKRTRGGLLRVAALYHDLGKPAARAAGRGQVSYAEHDRLGVEAWEALAQQRRMAPEQAKFVAPLIQHHMHPLELFGLSSVTDSAIDKLIGKAPTLLPELLLLFWADATAEGAEPATEERVAAFVKRVLDRAALPLHGPLRTRAEQPSGRDDGAT